MKFLKREGSFRQAPVITHVVGTYHQGGQLRPSALSEHLHPGNFIFAFFIIWYLGPGNGGWGNTLWPKLRWRKCHFLSHVGRLSRRTGCGQCPPGLGLAHCRLRKWITTWHQLEYFPFYHTLNGLQITCFVPTPPSCITPLILTHTILVSISSSIIVTNNFEDEYYVLIYYILHLKWRQSSRYFRSLPFYFTNTASKIFSINMNILLVMKGNRNLI